jgi:hypothetical protein
MTTSQPPASSAAEVPAVSASTPEWVIPVMGSVVWRFVLTVLGVAGRPAPLPSDTTREV